jgi:alpha-D-xyloside xylohydrolase
MLRPLLFDSPEDPSAWTEELAYRLGPDLLVAPMTDRGGTRMVYLPGEESWVDWWSGQVHPGGRWLRVAHQLDRVPLFVRYGALIPLAPVGDRVGEAPFTDLTLRSFGAQSTSTVLHDVNGSTWITAVRDHETYLVTVSGPAPVGRVEFAEVAGVEPPTRSVVTSIDAPDPS